MCDGHTGRASLLKRNQNVDKVKRLKQARDEAASEIEQLRAQKEAEFQQTVAKVNYRSSSATNLEN